MGGRYGGDIRDGHRTRYFRVPGLREASPEEVRRAAKHGKLKHSKRDDLTEGLTAAFRQAMNDAADPDPTL